MTVIAVSILVTWCGRFAFINILANQRRAGINRATGKTFDRAFTNQSKTCFATVLNDVAKLKSSTFGSPYSVRRCFGVLTNVNWMRKLDEEEKAWEHRTANLDIKQKCQVPRNASSFSLIEINHAREAKHSLSGWQIFNEIDPLQKERDRKSKREIIKDREMKKGRFSTFTFAIRPVARVAFDTWAIKAAQGVGAMSFGVTVMTSEAAFVFI